MQRAPGAGAKQSATWTAAWPIRHRHALRGCAAAAAATAAAAPGPPGAAPAAAEGDAPQWIRGPIRKGALLTSEGSLMVMGDVHKGARLQAAGDITVWGTLSGRAHAGCQGNAKAQIMALEMAGARVQVADVSTLGNAKVSVASPHVVAVSRANGRMFRQLVVQPGMPTMPAPSSAGVAATFSRWTTFNPAAAAALLTGVYAITLGLALLAWPSHIFGLLFKAAVPDGWVRVGGVLLATFGLQYLLAAVGDYRKARSNRRAVIAKGRGMPRGGEDATDAEEEPRQPPQQQQDSGGQPAQAQAAGPSQAPAATPGAYAAATAPWPTSAAIIRAPAAATPDARPQAISRLVDDSGAPVGVRFLPPGERTGVVDAPAQAGTLIAPPPPPPAISVGAASASPWPLPEQQPGAEQQQQQGGQQPPPPPQLEAPVLPEEVAQRVRSKYRRGRAPTGRSPMRPTAAYMHSTSFYRATVWSRLALAAAFCALVAAGQVEPGLLLLAAMNAAGAATMAQALAREEQLHATFQDPAP